MQSASAAWLCREVLHGIVLSSLNCCAAAPGSPPPPHSRRRRLAAVFHSTIVAAIYGKIL
jgi:hypothetical protein